MNLDDLIKQIQLYDGDVKAMEIAEMTNALRSVDEMKDSRRKLMEELAKEEEIQQKEIKQNPLLAYSTTELKKELRRRKGKLK